MDYISQAEILLQKDIEHSDALGSEYNKSMMLMALGILSVVLVIWIVMFVYFLKRKEDQEIVRNNFV